MAKVNKNGDEINPASAQADLENRSKAFNAEFIVLLGKYKLGLGAIPIILPDGRLSARPQLFDDSNPKVPETTEEKGLSKPE